MDPSRRDSDMGFLRVAGGRSNTLRGVRSKVMQTLRLRANRPIIAQPLSIRGGQHPRSRDVIESERHGCVMGKRGLAEKGIPSTRAGRRVAEEIASMLQLLPQNLRDRVDIITTGSG